MHGRAYNITRHEFTGFDVLFRSVADDASLHRDITLQAGNNVGSLLLLVPTDDGVEHQDTNNDTGINPILQTKSQDSGGLHDVENRTAEETNEFDQLEMD